MINTSHEHIKVKSIRYSKNLAMIPTEPDNELTTSQEDLIGSIYEKTKGFVEGGRDSFKYQPDREF